MGFIRMNMAILITNALATMIKTRRRATNLANLCSTNNFGSTKFNDCSNYSRFDKIINVYAKCKTKNSKSTTYCF
jgi:hypothetical protein